MKRILTVCALSIALLTGCDPQSEMAKKGVEKFGPTPTPSISPTPIEEPIDPADVVQVDVAEPGPTLVVNRERNETNCNKYNRVMLNGNGKQVSIKGACSELMLNGSSNEVQVDATSKIVLNGRYNIVRYSRYVNGKRPVVSGTTEGSTVEKVAASAAKK